MEQTGAKPEGKRKLVLGFDAGCLTCSELAKRIEERVGDKIEVRSLKDPMMRIGARRASGRPRLGLPHASRLKAGRYERGLELGWVCS